MSRLSKAWPTPALRIPHHNSRKLVFAPDGQIVVGDSDGGWFAFDVQTEEKRSLPLRGTHGTFFGRWLLVRDDHKHATSALEWRDGAAPVDCDIGFDMDALFRQCAIAAASTTMAAIVRDDVLHIRRGSPDTIDDERGWTSPGHISANVRLLCSSDGRYVVGCNAGNTLDVVDTSSDERKSIDLRAEGGHPYWASIHPTEPWVAVFSRYLVIVDLKSRAPEAVLRLPQKLSGEYLPDGTLLFATEAGVMTWNGRQLRVVSPAISPYHENLPLRVSPDGRFVIVPSEADLAVYETSALLEES